MYTTEESFNLHWDDSQRIDSVQYISIIKQWVTDASSNFVLNIDMAGGV